MQEVATLADDAPDAASPGAIRAHCPRCGTAVHVHPDQRAWCASCQTPFDPAGLRTAKVRRRPALGDPDDPLVGQRLGPWELVRRIGRGGMGRVYEAQDVQRGRGRRRRAAIKVLDETLAADPAFVKRFRREARLLGDLAHPHVVRVLEQGEQDGRLFFVMDLVRGENLRQRMERGPLPAEDAARIASQVAAALAYAHGRGIVHRDLKPENVLLDAQGQVHLADFGLSRLVAESSHDASTRLTRTDVIMGTYEYMAPEQRRGDRSLDGRADLFSLGVILYEMLVGSLPLGRFALPSEARPGLPRGFDTVTSRALATDPGKRYESAADFQDALRRALRDTPAAPPPPPRTPQQVHESDLVLAQGALRHIEILAGLDRGAGILLILMALGATWLQEVIAWQPADSILRAGFVVCFVGGLVLLNLGRKLRALQAGARESQITASVVMLLVPPVFTVVGAYGLWVMTSAGARRAFQLGAGVLRPEGRPTVVKPQVVELSAPDRPREAHLLLRLFHFVAILGSLYAAFVGLEMLAIPDRAAAPDWLDASHVARAIAVRNGTILAAAFAFLLCVWTFSIRQRRRGLGLAVLSFLFLLAAGAFLIVGIENAHAHAPHLFASWHHGALPLASGLTESGIPSSGAIHLPSLPPTLEYVR